MQTSSSTTTYSGGIWMFLFILVIFVAMTYISTKIKVNQQEKAAEKLVDHINQQKTNNQDNTI